MFMEIAKRRLQSIADHLIPYAPTIGIIMLAVICAEFGIRGIHVPLKGIEHDPSLSAIALHIFSHNHGLHFLGNFGGMFFYAALFSLVTRQVDMRQNNLLFFVSLISVVGISTVLALFVWPNDNGVAGISGVVNFLMAYFWIGCVSILVVSYSRKTKIRLFNRIDRIIQRRASLIPLALLLIVAGLHWLYDGLEDFIPHGENPIGKLYHLVGFSIGCLAGVTSALLWFKSSDDDARN